MGGSRIFATPSKATWSWRYLGKLKKKTPKLRRKQTNETSCNVHCFFSCRVTCGLWESLLLKWLKELLVSDLVSRWGWCLANALMHRILALPVSLKTLFDFISSGLYGVLLPFSLFHSMFWFLASVYWENKTSFLKVLVSISLLIAACGYN